MTMCVNENSFALGYSQLTVGQAPLVRRRIISALGINNRASWANKLAGRSTLSPAERLVVEGIFRAFGITDVWGPARSVEANCKDGGGF